MTSIVALLLWGVAAFLGTAVLAVAVSRRGSATHLVYGATLGISAVMFVIVAAELTGDPAGVSTVTLPLGLPWIGAHFRLDALSAFFLVVVNLGGAVASLYGLGYGHHEPAPHRVLPFFPAFLAGMNLVVLADDAFTFLLSWEFMSLASWALVMAHHREQDNTRAGYIYLVMASFGTLALLLAFGLLAGPGGTYTFDAMRAAEPSRLVAAAVLVLMLLGAGSKAGLVPLHVWLPLAHPAAPSHVSALMSGVMTKVAVYGFIRVIFDLLGEPAWWSGVVVLFLGGLTAVLGILYALMEKDLKRLLAYSTIENIGVIFVSLGLALAFKANAMPSAAALALTAALFHVLNHSFFKSLLFFGAGAVLTATGERNMEKLGGLIHRMPLDQLCLSRRLRRDLGTSALQRVRLRMAGLPGHPAEPRSAAMGPEGHGARRRRPAGAVGGAGRGLFRKGVRDHISRPATDRGGGTGARGRPLLAGGDVHSRGPLSACRHSAGPCHRRPVTGDAFADRQPHAGADGAALAVDRADRREPQLLQRPAGVSCSSRSPHRSRHSSFTASPRMRCAVVPPGAAAFPDVTPAAQYTAVSFAQPIRRVFGTFAFRAREKVEMPPPGATGPARLTVEMHDVIWETFYQPIAGAVGFATERLNHLQFLTIRRYLTLVFLYLVTLLLVLALWP